MSFILLLIAGFFLPLFPLSMVFNTLLDKVKHPVARILLILIWPQIGVLLLFAAHLPLESGFLVVWALFSAVLIEVDASTGQARRIERISRTL